MHVYSKAVAILIMFLFLMALAVPITDGDCQLDDMEDPVTSIFFDEYSGMVTLVAVVYPLGGERKVNATYYKIDGGPQTKYTLPFQLPEGTHTVRYWSVDNFHNMENIKSATFTYDSTPPSVEIISPELGEIYFHGNRILTLGDKTICIGKVPISVVASDETSGVDMVFFKVMNDTGFDTTPPYEYTYKGAHFGELTITVTAMDKLGWMSEPATMTIDVYSLGIL
jgi:hypothetical protein